MTIQEEIGLLKEKVALLERLVVLEKQMKEIRVEPIYVPQPTYVPSSVTWTTPQIYQNTKTYTPGYQPYVFTYGGTYITEIGATGTIYA